MGGEAEPAHRSPQDRNRRRLCFILRRPPASWRGTCRSGATTTTTTAGVRRRVRMTSPRPGNVNPYWASLGGNLVAFPFSVKGLTFFTMFSLTKQILRTPVCSLMTKNKLSFLKKKQKTLRFNIFYYNPFVGASAIMCISFGDSQTYLLSVLPCTRLPVLRACLVYSI